jgi:hypothetical protein
MIKPSPLSLGNLLGQRYWQLTNDLCAKLDLTIMIGACFAASVFVLIV